MRRNLVRFNALVIGFCYALMAGFPAIADDTEIFFGGGDFGASDGVYPNVLFILDTSGSMRTDVGNTNKSRMQHMQEAMEMILDSATGINVGLMRFNDPGGPILFPVSNIDAEISTATPTTSLPTVESRIMDSADDAEEQGGAVNLSSKRLEAVYISGDANTFSARIDVNDDDAEETISNGNVSRGGNTLNIHDNQINGFRFDNTGIPQGATIDAATITLTAKANSTDAMTLRFYGEKHDDAAPFDNNKKDISNRNKSTAYVDWQPETWSKDQEYSSPDISNIVSELVSQVGWAEDDLVILQTFETGSGERKAYTRNSDKTKAARLDVTYKLGTPGAQSIGLRFRDIGVPQGATITSAKIEFTASQSNDGVFNTGLTVQGIDEDDTVAFENSAANITGRNATTANVVWIPDAWTDGDVVQTPELKTITQEIVDRAGWCGNNAMGFSISGPDLVNRVAHSFDGSPQFAPVLRVTYDDSNIPDGGGCINQTLVYRVNAAENDAEEKSDKTISLGGNVLNMNASQTNGLRFENIMINQGAEIVEARVILTAESADTASSSLVIKGQAADNALAFVRENGNITDRTTTSASVSWAPGDWVKNSDYTSPDIKTLIKEIVDRGSWQPGNALALIQTGSGDQRRAYTYNNQPADAALLKIKVKSGGVAQSAKKKVRSKLKELVNEFVPSGYTPIVDTMYEAANYYRGGNVLYGKKRGAQTTYGRVSHPDSYTGGTVSRADGCTDDNLNASACSTEEITGSPKYTTPMTDQCQTNHVVLLTDGQANHNNSTASIKSLAGITSCDTSSGVGGETCGRELAGWLATSDHSDTLNNKQSVQTYTIGFNLDAGGQASAVEFLQDLATEGGGNYYSADTADQLAGVFQNIIRSIVNTDTTFVSPGATVNQFNRLTHQNDIYFSVFKPADGPMWAGNLKRYELKGDPAIIVDANNKPAVNPATGFFDEKTKSFWSQTKDGNKVPEGGAASKLTLLNRNVYTYLGTSNVLSHSSNKLHEDTATITNALLGIEAEPSPDAHRTNLLKWARGLNVKKVDEFGAETNIRKQIGAPLHSQAVILTYGGTDAAPDNVVFFGTNEGYLHAIDTDDGTEIFSFVPPELLGNLNTFYKNAVAANIPYGLDGPITYWVKDVNGDHIIDANAGDHVYIYVGMRRGGRNLYALDVTSRDNPELMWTIKGGTGSFTELGQTWSSAVHTQVKIEDEIKQVLIFAGGYDEDQDDKTTRSADTQGRAIYIVDAASGALLWSGGPTTNPNGTYTQTFVDMNYSMPADIRILDMNSDGLADQMYVGDMGGQLWRFDINNGAVAGSLVGGGVIADLALNAGGNNDVANNRRFYYAPDVSMIRRGAERMLSIAIGSGWRAHPLDTSVQDRFYMIRNSNVYAAPASYTKLTESNLYDATDNIIGEGTGTDPETANSTLWNSSQGWFIDLENSGEKVLAESLTVNNQILFTTYQPTASNSSCSAGRGKGRLYVVSAYDATPVMNLDQVGTEDSLTKSDRAIDLARNGIPPKPAVLFPDDVDGSAVPDPLLCVGAECDQDIDFGSIMERTFWREISNN